MSERKGGHFKTFTGRRVYPLDLRPEDIDPVDIAHHLAMICRFGGGVKHHYSVAQHSFLMAVTARNDSTKELVAHALLHDAAEAYLGDVIRPLKRCAEFAAYRDAEEQAMCAIADRFGLPHGFEKSSKIKHLDNLILAAEKRDLTVPWADDEELPDPRDVLRIGELSPSAAKARWLGWFSLCVEKGLVSK